MFRLTLATLLAWFALEALIILGAYILHEPPTTDIEAITYLSESMT